VTEAQREAEAHAQAVFARMTARRRLPGARRARGQSGQRKDLSTQQPAVPKWESGQDKALPPGDRE